MIGDQSPISRRAVADCTVLIYENALHKLQEVLERAVLLLSFSTWRYNINRRNISIGIPLDLSIPTEMTSIGPLVENEKSSKTPKNLKIMLCYIFSDC